MQQALANLLPAVFHGREAGAVMKTTVAALAWPRFETHFHSVPPSQLLHPPNKLAPSHDFIIAHMCTTGRPSFGNLDGNTWIRDSENFSRPAPNPALKRAGCVNLGTPEVARRNRSLRTTGPERTLIDSFRQPHLAGGVEELVESAAGHAGLDLDLLQELLELYGTKGLWAAVDGSSTDTAVLSTYPMMSFQASKSTCRARPNTSFARTAGGLSSRGGI